MHYLKHIDKVEKMKKKKIINLKLNNFIKNIKLILS